MNSLVSAALITALSMMQASPSSTEAMQRVNVATTLWVSCAEGHSAKLAVSPINLEMIADETFRMCADIEPIMTAEMQLVGMQPEIQVEQLKRDFRVRIEENVGSVRALLNLPR